MVVSMQDNIYIANDIERDALSSERGMYDEFMELYID